jgi:hypothetical protein
MGLYFTLCRSEVYFSLHNDTSLRYQFIFPKTSPYIVFYTINTLTKKIPLIKYRSWKLLNYYMFWHLGAIFKGFFHFCLRTEEYKPSTLSYVLHRPYWRDSNIRILKYIRLVTIKLCSLERFNY